MPKQEANGVIAAQNSIMGSSGFGSFTPEDLLTIGGFGHTPPAFSPGTEIPIKRTRTGSISGRLRSASDLEEKGFIDRYQKGILKDLIISGDSRLHDALDKYEKGDPTELEALMESGALNRKSSLDLLEELDLGFLSMSNFERSPPNVPAGIFGSHEGSFREFDEIPFEMSFSYGSGTNSELHLPSVEEHHEESEPDAEASIYDVLNSEQHAGGILSDPLDLPLGDLADMHGLGVAQSLHDASLDPLKQLSGSFTEKESTLSAQLSSEPAKSVLADDGLYQPILSSTAGKSSSASMKPAKKATSTVASSLGSTSTSLSSSSARSGSLSSVSSSSASSLASTLPGSSTYGSTSRPSYASAVAKSTKTKSSSVKIPASTAKTSYGSAKYKSTYSSAGTGAGKSTYGTSKSTYGTSKSTYGSSKSTFGTGKNNKSTYSASLKSSFGAGKTSYGTSLSTKSSYKSASTYGGLGKSSTKSSYGTPKSTSSFAKSYSSVAKSAAGGYGKAGAGSAASLSKYASSSKSGSASSALSSSLYSKSSTGGSSYSSASGKSSSSSSSKPSSAFMKAYAPSSALATSLVSQYNKSSSSSSSSSSSTLSAVDKAGAALGLTSTGTFSSSVTAGKSPSAPISIPGSDMKSKSQNDGKRYIGAYSPESRIKRIQKFLEKREKRVWTKKVKYDVRKNFADSRLRVKGRFVKKEDEALLRELLSLT